MKMLNHVGTVVAVQTEEEITTLTSITAMISFFYATSGTMHEWCVANGVANHASRRYIASFFHALSASAVRQEAESFMDMALEAATPGGLNEQTHAQLQDSGTYASLTQCLQGINNRLTQK